MEEPECWKPSASVEELLARALIVQHRVVPVDIVDSLRGSHMTRSVYFGESESAPEEIWGTSSFRRTLAPRLRQAENPDLEHLADWLERDGELSERADGNFLIPELLWPAAPGEDEYAAWASARDRLVRIADSLARWVRSEELNDPRVVELADGLKWSAEERTSPWIGW